MENNELPNNNYIPTLNGMGYMTTILDPYSIAFVEFCASCTRPVADLGVAFGATTLRALNTGATVYANDLDPRHLERLYRSTPEEQKHRLHLKVGKFPGQINFSKGELSAILAARCFQFLTGDEIEKAVCDFYQWLSPGGKAFVVVETPYIKPLEKFIPLYEERKRKGDPWPGFVEDWTLYNNRPNVPTWTNMLDQEILIRTFHKAGFYIEKSGYFPRPYFPAEVKLDGRESVGIIGVKN